ncbi:MAG: FliA/WhiG family RNA polymerase sigma factor [Deltaproteobacteria bacterium]|nr:FliA/WhiG family RNA polymerase sigma factor [Deltaproteobacteria bacterium]
MATSPFSGNRSFSTPEPWDVLEKEGRPFSALDFKTQEDIVRSYGKRIRKMAFRLKARVPAHVDVHDFISAGSLGLMEALAKFDPAMGVCFQVYADGRIRGAMLDEMRRMDWFSKGMRRRLKTIEQCIRDLEQDLGRFPATDEIAARAELTLEDVEQGLVALDSQVFLSLDLIEEVSSTAGSGLSGSEPYREAVFRELVDKLAQLIDDLTERERLVLSLYYAEELTMREVAEVMEITEGRVSQLHSQALRKLRVRMDGMGWE